jgi:predicted small metal-binding protein
MTRQVRCECGYTARGVTDEAVIDLVLKHLESEHPELAGIETR